MTHKIKPGWMEFTTTLTAEDAPDIVKELLKPVSEWRPPDFNITPGDAKPGTTIVARVTRDESTEDGCRIDFESNLREVMYTENPETGEVLFYAVADGGYKFPISREAFIELAIQMSNGADPEGDRADLDEMIPRSKV